MSVVCLTTRDVKLRERGEHSKFGPSQGPISVNMY